MPSPKNKKENNNLPASQNVAPKELSKRLGDCIERLQRLITSPYTGASSLDCWPTRNELNGLAKAVGKLGSAIGIEQVDIEHLNGVMRHIDRRYPKLGSLAFFEGLVRKIENVPIGPVTRIRQQLAAGVDTNSRKQLEAIRDLLTRLEWKITVKPGTWRELGPKLFELSGGQIKEARNSAKLANMQEIDFVQDCKMFNEAFGLAAFLEVQRQYLVWRLRWDCKVLPVVEWIYFLKNPDWDSRMRRVISNPNITPAEWRLDDRKFQERTKKRTYRKKLSSCQ